MSAYHLRKTEILYELKVRNQPTEGTAGDLRKRLSQCFASNIEVDDAVVNDLDTEAELEECEGKYQDLSALISDYEGNYNDNEFHRIIARLWHLVLRAERIPIGAAAENDQEENRDKLIIRCKELLNSFKKARTSSTGISQAEKTAPSSIIQNFPQEDQHKHPALESLDYKDTSRDPAVIEDEHTQQERRRQHQESKGLEDWLCQEQEKLREERKRLEDRWYQEERRLLEERKEQEERLMQEERQLRKKFLKKEEEKSQDKGGNAQDKQQCFEWPPQEKGRDSMRPRYVPVYKWGLKFDNSGPSIAAFLERVEELRRARGVTHQELYESAVDLFAGSALIWYRAAANRIQSWHQLTKELREVFQPADYDLRLHQEIFNRTQGDHEPIDLYIAAMEGLYSRLATAVPETTRLAQIYNNLHPQLQDRLALCNVQTLEQLRAMGRRAEAGRLGMTRVRPSPRSETTLEPDLAYQDQGRRKGPSTGRVAYFQPTASRDRQEVTCWNCDGKGHRFRFCRKPKKKFCYGCGKDNTFKRECPSCNPKNEQGREAGTH